MHRLYQIVRSEIKDISAPSRPAATGASTPVETPEALGSGAGGNIAERKGKMIGGGAVFDFPSWKYLGRSNEFVGSVKVSPSERFVVCTFGRNWRIYRLPDTITPNNPPALETPPDP